MAEIRRRAVSAPISNFRQVAPSSGGGFALLAEAMQTAYKMLEPAAKKEMEALGDEAGQDFIRANMGAVRPASLAGASSMGGDMASYADAISAIESGGNYGAQGPITKSGDRAYGKYQVMGSNIGPWTEQHLGRRMTAEEFLASPEAQDAVFQGQFGSYVRRYGNPQDAASAWFTGRPLSQGAGAKDILGTSGAAYVEKFNRNLGQRVAGASSKGGKLSEPIMEPQVAPPTTVITGDGKTELRQFSPIAGPLLQIHNAAAQAAVGMEVLNQGEIALMDLSRQLEADPQGFQQAAKSYVDEVLKGLPREMRPEVRTSLSRYAARRFVGMMETRQNETRQRASNANKALVDRWGDAYAEALASGDAETIAEAQTKLDSALGLRETLPGLSWTPEQSENVRITARKKADQMLAQQRRDAQSTVKSQINGVIRAAKEGLTSADEGMLQDPAVKELFPDLWNEAASWVVMRDMTPEMWQQTPQELAAEVAAARAQPIVNDFQVDQIKVLESLAKDQAKAFAEDPIKRAQQVLPGAVTSLDPSSPEKFGASLSQRFEDAMGLAGFDEAGERTGRAYVNQPVLLSKDEANTMAALFGPETPVELRLAYAQAAVQALGPNTGLLLRQVKMDPVLKMGALLQSVGGDPNVAAQALRGQEMLAAGLVMAPTQAATIKEVSTDIADAIGHIPAETQADILAFAKGIYASQARGLDPSSDDAKKLLTKAINSALGQSVNGRGQVTGGAQKIGGSLETGRAGPSVLLPIGVTAEEANNALGLALGRKPRLGSLDGIINGIAGSGLFAGGLDRLPDGTIVPKEQIVSRSGLRADLWAAADAVSVPMLGGEPIKQKWLDDGWLQFTPHHSVRNVYLMQLRLPNGTVSDIRDSNGNAFFFNLPKLIEATR